MADSGQGENIGAMNVSITGDYSGLQAAFATAQGVAQTAGEDIADAFSGGAAGVTAFDDAAAAAATTAGTLADSVTQAGDAASESASAVSGLGDSLDSAGSDAEAAEGGVSGFGDATTAAGDAAAGAAGDVTEFGSATDSAGSDAEAAEGGLAGMAEQLTLIGEALIVTEGLKDFGEAALEASDNVTHASIALTTLTHDAEGVQTTLEGLSQLGQTDGLAMPSLLTAATRMTAVLGPGHDVVSLLGSIADGSQTMGTDITAAVQKFDQMATAGTASGRTLQSLGLSLQSLAVAFNQVVPGADATSSSVAAMFKALSDPDQRIAVLTAALSKMGGTAQQVADQTFGGQWNQLTAQWDEALVGAGNALLPVISGLTSFLKLDVVPFIQDMVAEFKSMPEPVQQAAVVLGILAAAAIPLVGGLAAVGLAVGALSNLMPAATALMEAFGLASTETAAEEGTAAASSLALAAAQQTQGAASGEAAGETVLASGAALGLTAALKTQGAASVEAAGEIEELGASATAAGAEVEAAGIVTTGLAGILGGILITGISAAVFGFADLKASIASAESAYKDLSEAATNQWVQNLSQQLATGKLSVQQMTDAMASLKTGIDNGAVSASTAGPLYQKLGAAINAMVGPQILPTIQGLSGGLTILGTTSSSTAKAIQSIADTVTKQDQAVVDAKAALDFYTAGLNNNTTSQQQVNLAQEKYNAAVKAGMEGVKDATSTVTAFAGQLDINAASAAVAADHNMLLGQNVAALGQALFKAEQAVANEQQAIDLNVGSTNALVAAKQKAQQAAVAYQQALDKLHVSQAEDAADTGDETSELNVLGISLAGAKAHLADLDTEYLNHTATMKQVQAGIKAVNDAQIALDVAEAEAKADVNGSTDSYTLLQVQLAGAKAKLADLTTEWGNNEAKLKDVVAAQKAVVDAQTAVDVSAAENATGLVGQTDDVSLLIVQLAGAKAKLADLDAEYQTNSSLAGAVASATKNVASLQSQLNTALGTGTTTAKNYGGAMQQAAAAVTAFNNAQSTVPAGSLAVTNSMYAEAQAALHLANAVGSLSDAYNTLDGATTQIDAINSKAAGVQLVPGSALWVAAMIALGGGNPNVSGGAEAAELGQQGGSAGGTNPNATTSGTSSTSSTATTGTASSSTTGDNAVLDVNQTLGLAQLTQALNVAEDQLNAAEASGDATMIATAQAAVTAANTAWLAAGGAGPGTGTGTSTTATTTTTPLSSSGASVLVDEESGGTLYGQLQELITGAGISSSASASTASAIQSVATSTASATSATVAAAATMTNVVGVIGTATTSIAASVATVATNITSVVGAVQTLNSGLQRSLTANAAVASTTATTGVAGGATNVLNPGGWTTIGQIGATSVVPGAGGGNQISFSFQGANFGGMSPADVQNAVTAAFTQAVRTAGARF